MNKKSITTLAIGTFLSLSFAVPLFTNEVFLNQIKDPDAHFVRTSEEYIRDVYATKSVVPTDTYYSTQKNYSMSNVGDIESAWDIATGKGVTIAIIDDGFEHDHSEYKRKDGTSAILSTSRYYYSDDYGNVYYKSYSSDATCIDESWSSDYGEWDTHGSNTSTTAAAPMNNGGIVGIAPEADILALKIDLSFAAMKDAMEYAIAQGADIISMSLGAYSKNFTDGFGYSEEGSSEVATYLESTCEAAYQAGIIVVAAAGNEATSELSYPACNAHVIGVGALAKNSTKLAAFTNFNKSLTQTGEKNVDILAPGYVYAAGVSGSSSSSKTNTWFETAGTSFSCPITAGAAALWKEINPTGTPSEFQEALTSTADGIGEYKTATVYPGDYDSSYSKYGPYTANLSCGRVNVYNLLDTTSVSSVSVTPDVYKAENIGETQQLTVTVLPSTAENKEVTYSSSNNSICTVSATGLITTVSKGVAEITVTSVDNPNKSATTKVYVGEEYWPAEPSWKLCTSSTDLVVGGQYTFGAPDYDVVCSPLGENKYLGTLDAEFTDNNLNDLPEGGETFILGGSSGSYTLKQASTNKLLGTTGKKTLVSGSGSTTWNISFSGDNVYISTIYSSKSYKLTYNNESPRWTTYTSDMKAYCLYRNENYEQPVVTSISASYSDDAYVGETLDLSSLTVSAIYSDESSEVLASGYDVADADHMFTYDETSHTFTVTYKTFTTTFAVDVARHSYVTPEGDSININKTACSGIISSSSSNPSTGNFEIDGITYYFSNSYTYNTYISFGKISNPGTIYNVDAFSGNISSISVKYKSGSPEGTVSISEDGSTWVTYSESECAKGNYKYFKLSFTATSESSYINLSNINIVLIGQESAKNIANDIMYEDTTNQCLTKFYTVRTKYLSLSESEKETFKTSSDYVISTARERYEAWAKSLDEKPYENAKANSNNSIEFNSNDSTIYILTILGVSLLGMVCLIALKKKGWKINEK